MRRNLIVSTSNGTLRTGSAWFGRERQAPLHAVTDGPAIAVQVEIVALSAERFLDDGIDQADEVAAAYAPYFDTAVRFSPEGWALVQGLRR